MPSRVAHFATYEGRIEAVVAVINPLQANIWVDNCKIIRRDEKAHLRSTLVYIGHWVEMYQPPTSRSSQACRSKSAARDGPMNDVHTGKNGSRCQVRTSSIVRTDGHSSHW